MILNVFSIVNCPKAYLKSLRKSGNKTLYIIAGVIIFGGLLIGLNNFLEHKIKKGLESVLNESKTSYEEVNVSLLGSLAEVKNLKFHKAGKEFTAQNIKVKRLNLLKYLRDGNIIIGNLEVKGLHANFNRAEEEVRKETDTSSGFKEEILIKSLSVSNSDLRIIKGDSSSKPIFYISLPKVRLGTINLNAKTLEAAVPFTYKSIELRSDSVFVRMNSQHDITVGTTRFKNGELSLKDFRIHPLYSEAEFKNHIPYEKDHVRLRIKKIDFNKLEWAFNNDSLEIRNPLLKIGGVKLQIYRDKTQPDDQRYKPLYSRMIRDLPFRLKLDTLRLQNVFIEYKELKEKERGPGVLRFHDLNASIYNLSNIGLHKKEFPSTDIDVSTLFMGENELKVHWNFDISNRADHFNISGSLNGLSAKGMNSFLKPAMNIEAKGDIEDMSFSYSGNNDMATGEMKLTYKDFKVEVLKKKSEKKNKILSALANLIIHNKAKNENAVQDNIKVQRDKTKSFWNYFWLCIRNGALKSFL